MTAGNCEGGQGGRWVGFSGGEWRVVLALVVTLVVLW